MERPKAMSKKLTEQQIYEAFDLASPNWAHVSKNGYPLDRLIFEEGYRDGRESQQQKIADLQQQLELCEQHAKIDLEHLRKLKQENERLKEGSARAIELLNVAAKYIETHWTDGIVHYDEADCDGYCVAEDCRLAAEQLASEGE